jgi:transposase-like protein
LTQISQLMSKVKRGKFIRYSESFKQEIVREVEQGTRSLAEVRRAYNLGSCTIQKWIKRMGKFDLLPRAIRVETPNEKDRIKELERQIKDLKNALAETQVRYIIAESQLEVVCEQQGLDVEEVKKKLKDKPSSKQ